MPCAAFEDLLSGYDDLTAGERDAADAHLAVCGNCRAYLETLADLDRELAGIFAEIQPRLGFAARVVSRTGATQKPIRLPRRPSAWPEVLDFCGWAAVVAIVALLAATVARQAGITL
jgi:anti-sigma factor RsiW